MSFGYNNLLQNKSDPALVKGVPIGLIGEKMILTVDFNGFSVRIPNNSSKIPFNRYLSKGLNSLWVDMSVTFQKSLLKQQVIE